jgi:hypothetical protein
MDVDGLWTVEGATLEGWPISGAMVFFRMHVFGGNDRYYCLGSYRPQGHMIEIDTHLYHYHGATYSSVGGSAPDFVLHYRGRVMMGSEMIEAEVNRAESPYPKYPVKLLRRAPLST